MSPKQRLKARLQKAAAEHKSGNFDEAGKILARVESDPEVDALGYRTSLGLPRQLQAARLKLAKAQKDAVSSIGYQFNLVPPPELLNQYTQFSSAERKQIAALGHEAVPRKIHQIWIGPDTQPIGTQSWKHHAAEHGYDYQLWGARELQELGIDKNSVYSQMLARGDYPGAVDVARYAILEKMGGVYLDCDWYPARNDISFHDLVPMLGLTAMPENTPRNTGKGGLLVANSMIAAPPHHPVFTRLLAALPDVMNELPNEPAWWSTGPLIFTLMSRGGSLTLADAAIVAGALPQETPLIEVQRWCEEAQARDQGLLLAWKSWVW